MEELNKLKDKFPWPMEKPDLPFNDHGWFPQCNKDLLSKHLTDAKVVVELGSWLGLSSRWILENSPNAILICIDHWQGGFAELSSEQKDMIPSLYETFISNCWLYRNRMIVLKMSTLEGMDTIESFGIKPDVIYVDAGHDYEHAKADISRACRFGCPLVGDDFNPLSWEGVVRAVWEESANYHSDILVHGSAWEMKIKKKL